MMRFDVFGREVLVERTRDGWTVYEAGTDGTRRRARDIRIPGELAEGEVRRYLDDLCHERATPARPAVRRLD